MSNWYIEELAGHWRQGLPVRECLVDEKSPYQHIQLFDTVEFGKMLVLDGKVQCTELDECSYHEMLAHLPLLTHPAPGRVVVVGGGDGGTMREVLKHSSVRHATLLEIDEQVIEVCRRWLPGLAKGLQPSPRLQVVTEDAALAIARVEPQDVVLVDSSDPEGPSEVLFTRAFFQSMQRALQPDGILALQAGSPYFFRRQIAETRRLLEELFPVVRPYLVSVPTYPGGTWCMLLAAQSEDHDPLRLSPEQLQSRIADRRLSTRYYSPAVHHASLAWPPCFDEP